MPSEKAPEFQVWPLMVSGAIKRYEILVTAIDV